MPLYTCSFSMHKFWLAISLLSCCVSHFEVIYRLFLVLLRVESCLSCTKIPEFEIALDVGGMRVIMTEMLQQKKMVLFLLVCVCVCWGDIHSS